MPPGVYRKFDVTAVEPPACPFRRIRPPVCLFSQKAAATVSICDIFATFARNFKSMFQFISLGSGSSGNCYYLFSEHGGLLIDVGIGIRTLKKHFQTYGFSLNDIQQILVTHDHADHVKTVGVVSNDYGVPVYATEKVHKGIFNNFCVHKKPPVNLLRHVIPGTVFKAGDFEVTPFTIPHDSSDNVGYRIVYDGIVFCMMTDVGHVTDEMKAYIAEANYLVIESNYDEDMLRLGHYPKRLKERISNGTGHLSNAACANALVTHATARLRHVWLCHLSEENNHPELARKTLEQALREREMSSEIHFGFDVLKRKVPGKVYSLE